MPIQPYHRKECLMYSLHLHERLVQALQALRLPISAAQCENLAWLCQALALGDNCHLASLAVEMAVPSQREHLIQRLRRFLKTPDLAVPQCYAPLVRHLLQHWDGHDLNLVMDRTDIEHDVSLVTLGVAYRKRLLPLAWAVTPFGPSDEAHHKALLARVQPAVAAAPCAQVTFYADCEFRAVGLQQACRDWHWHWQVGVKSDTYYQSPTGAWQQLCAIPLAAGQRRYLQAVRLTREQAFGPVNLIAAWPTHQPRPRYWALDQPADAWAWRRGRKRFWIEPTFRDWKGYGFDLERSYLTARPRLDVLLLGMALTTLWLIHVGDGLLRSGGYQQLMPRAKRDYSVFRLGRDYVQRCRVLEEEAPIGFTVTHGA